MANKKPAVHVVPRGPEWVVKRGGSERASAVAPTQREAEAVGRRIAQNDKAELITHGQNGRFRSKDSFGPDPNPPKDKEH